jgi:hypothetical protein
MWQALWDTKLRLALKIATLANVNSLRIFRVLIHASQRACQANPSGMPEGIVFSSQRFAFGHLHAPPAAAEAESGSGKSHG